MTLIMSRQNGKLRVRLGKRRTRPVRHWLLALEHPILKAGHVSMFLVSPKPQVKPDVPGPSLRPSLWFNGHTDRITLCNGSHSVARHGTVWDYSVKKETRGSTWWNLCLVRSFTFIITFRHHTGTCLVVHNGKSDLLWRPHGEGRVTHRSRPSLGSAVWLSPCLG